MKQKLPMLLLSTSVLFFLHGFMVNAEGNEEPANAVGTSFPLSALMDTQEAKQHKQLTLSLRNQRLLEQQAESRAKQLLFQLQAAEAWAAIQRLGGEFSNASPAEPAVVAVGEADKVPERFLHYKIHALVYREPIWLARVNNGFRMITLRDGDTVVPGVTARVHEATVELVADNWRHTLSVE